VVNYSAISHLKIKINKRVYNPLWALNYLALWAAESVIKSNFETNARESGDPTRYVCNSSSVFKGWWWGLEII